MTNKKLRIGLLVDGNHLDAWERKMIDTIMNSSYAEVVYVVINGNEVAAQNKTIVSKVKNNLNRLPYLLVRYFLELLYEKLIDRQPVPHDACESTDCSELFSQIESIKVKTNRKEWSDYFFDDDLACIRKQNLDILIRCGFGILRGDILNLPKYGIWSFHHGDNLGNRGGPAGYWESMESWPETGSVLLILNEDLDNGKVLARTYSCTEPMSVNLNRNNYYWKTLLFMPRKLEELHRLGGEAFFKNVERENCHPLFYSERLYRQPGNAELTILTFQKIKEKIKLLTYNQFYFDQWILMFHIKDELSSSLWRYKKIVPPKDRFWADPHVIYKNDKYYIFIEEYFYATGKGHISLITMEQDGCYNEPEVILETSYHLSYPFVFEHDGEYYMIPDTRENKTIELYKCTEFPNKWSFQMNLMENVEAVDTTLYYKDGRWWMFTNLSECKGVSDWDELFLFRSPDFKTTEWIPHPMNPIVSDCKSARPAGKLFTMGGRLYRPSQNCSHRYGYGFNLCEVITLDETSYSENIVSKVYPNWDKDILGTHSFSREKSLHVIDAMIKRRR